MPKKIFVIPRDGLIVLDPDTNVALPLDGGFVEMNSHYKRRLRDGDIVIQPRPTATPPKQTKTTKSRKGAK